MHGYQAPTKIKRTVKPVYGLASVRAGESYIAMADKFAEANQELYDAGDAWWSSQELVTLCVSLFPEQQYEKWAKSASQWAYRIDAGASNPLRRERVYRLVFDKSSGQYLMTDPVSAINLFNIAEDVERAAVNGHAKEGDALRKAHHVMDPEEQHRAEAAYRNNGSTVQAAMYYNQNPHLNLLESARAAAGQLGNGDGGGDEPKQTGKKKNGS